MSASAAIRPKGKSTKATIYEAAVDLFSRQGYGASSMRAIAGIVGIEAASVYNHFSSKEELLYEIILRSTEDAIAFIESRVADAGSAPLARLEAATRAHVTFHCRNHKTAHIGWADLHSLGPKRFSQVRKVRDQYEEIFCREITAGIAAGQIIDTNKTLATNGILAIGSRTAARFRPDGPISEEEAGNYYGSFVLRSLIARPDR